MTMKSAMGMGQIMLALSGMSIPSYRPPSYVNEKSSRSDVLSWFFNRCLPDEQKLILESPQKRMENENADCFLRRRHIQRTVLHYIEKHPEKFPVTKGEVLS